MNGPKFRLVSDGKHTYFELCGKSIGKGISSVSYVHEAGRNPEITISFNLNDFEFLEDGKVDMVTNTLIGVEPPDKTALRNKLVAFSYPADVNSIEAITSFRQMIYPYDSNSLIILSEKAI